MPKNSNSILLLSCIFCYYIFVQRTLILYYFYRAFFVIMYFLFTANIENGKLSIRKNIRHTFREVFNLNI